MAALESHLSTKLLAFSSSSLTRLFLISNSFLYRLTLDFLFKSGLNNIFFINWFKYIFTSWTSMVPAARFVPWLKTTKAVRKFHDRWLEFCYEAYNKVKHDGTYPIVQLWKAMESGTMSEKELLNTVDESLFANVDVSASVVAWCILLSASHKGHQQRLRVEISQNAHDIDGYIRKTDTYLHYTLYEALRVRPIAPLIPPESATVDKVLEDGFIIPAGVKVITDVMSINVRDKFWGPEANKFRPERFEKLSTEDMKKHLFLFGFGPRQCLGKYIADKMVKTLLVYLYGRYEGVELPGGRDDKFDWKTKVDTFVQLPDVKIRLTKLAQPVV